MKYNNVFFVPLLDVLRKEQQGFLTPKFIHEAAKESSLSIYFSDVQKLVERLSNIKRNVKK